MRMKSSLIPLLLALSLSLLVEGCAKKEGLREACKAVCFPYEGRWSDPVQNCECCAWEITNWERGGTCEH